MAATDEAKKGWLTQNVASDLLYLLDEAEVGLDTQYKLCQDYKTLRKLSAIADTRAELREALKTEYGLDGSTNAAQRSEVAAVIIAWESSKQHAEEEVKMRAEAKNLGVGRPLPHTERSAMKKAVEKAINDRLTERKSRVPSIWRRSWKSWSRKSLGPLLWTKCNPERRQRHSSCRLAWILQARLR